MTREADRHEGHERLADETLVGNSVARLRRLSELDGYEMADGDPDIRGWRVRDAEGNWTGAVHDLVADLETREVRYIDMALDEAPGDENHVLVPIGLARLDDDQHAVTLTRLTLETLRTMPRPGHGAISRDDECALLGRIAGSERPLADTGDAFYQTAEFRTDALRGARDPSRRITLYRIGGPPGGPPTERRF